jgi:hypothetical protein
VLAARDRGRPRPHWSFPWPLTATGRAKTTCRPHLVRFRLSTAPQAVSIFFYLFDISMQISRYVGRVLRECSLSVLLVGATGSGPRRARKKRLAESSFLHTSPFPRTTRGCVGHVTCRSPARPDDDDVPGGPLPPRDDSASRDPAAPTPPATYSHGPHASLTCCEPSAIPRSHAASGID